MLIYGPPGVGKTQLARHVAAELGLPLLTARCDSLISSFLGSTAKNIRRLFDHAAERPCVLFLDEFDALAKARDDAQELGELKRVVVGLLQNIDAMPPSSVLIAATNHQQLLDPAVWRRFAFRVHIDLPNRDLRAALLNAYLGKFKPRDHSDWVVNLSEGFSGATLREVAEDCIRGAVISGRDTVAPEELIHRTVQTALIAQNLSPTEGAIARFLLERGVPQRLVSSASNMSMRQVLKLAADINKADKKNQERTSRKTRVAKKEIGRDRTVQKPGDSSRAPSKGAKAKASRGE
nr:ATP-binding protein [Stenotrophomonas acidaminiphila]